MEATGVFDPSIIGNEKKKDGKKAKASTRKVHRVQLDLPTSSMDRLTALKDMTDASTNAEVIRNAIRLYEAMVLEISAGREFFVKESNGSIIPYRMFI